MNKEAAETKTYERLPKPRRDYKDTIFRMIFSEKRELLALYNAVNGTDYDNPDELEITTLENAVYMTVKNDISCVIDMRLDLYEHQSTVNPNMPLEKAVMRAVDDCISEDILADFLRKNRAEVISMSIYEYDEKLHEQELMDIGREEGISIGREEGRTEGRTEGIMGTVKVLQGLGYSNAQITETLMETYALTQDEAAGYISRK